MSMTVRGLRLPIQKRKFAEAVGDEFGQQANGGCFSGISEGFEKYPQALIGTGRRISKGSRLNDSDVFSAMYVSFYLKCLKK